MIVIFSGPSGAGKSTVIKELIARHDNYELMPTMTTRTPRAGETQGDPYYFVTKEEFERLIAEGEFYEYQPVHNNYYGTNKKILNERLSRGKVLLKDIGVFGTANLKARSDIPSEIITIYFTLDEATLRQRLTLRGDSPEEIELRLSRVRQEAEFMGLYDLVTENVNLKDTVDTVERFIEGRIG